MGEDEDRAADDDACEGATDDEATEAAVALGEKSVAAYLDRLADFEHDAIATVARAEGAAGERRRVREIQARADLWVAMNGKMGAA